MSIAPNQHALKRRLDSFFWENRSGEVNALLSILRTHFQPFDRVAIIGGLVRDFAREGRSGFQSDVDLVIEAPKEDVASLARLLCATENVFGR